jgi:hypothetical protein
MMTEVETWKKRDNRLRLTFKFSAAPGEEMEEEGRGGVWNHPHGPRPE